MEYQDQNEIKEEGEIVKATVISINDSPYALLNGGNQTEDPEQAANLFKNYRKQKLLKEDELREAEDKKKETPETLRAS